MSERSIPLNPLRCAARGAPHPHLLPCLTRPAPPPLPSPLARPAFPPWKEELATTEFRQAVTAEYVGTFMFLFCTIGCVVFTQDGGISPARAVEVSMMFGGMIAILVFIMAGISGGNINPAVSLALAVTKKISPFRCVAYTIAQCLGATCGAGMVRIMTPALFDKVDGGANEISASANPTVRCRARACAEGAGMGLRPSPSPLLSLPTLFLTPSPPRTHTHAYCPCSAGGHGRGVWVHLLAGDDGDGGH